ncbi:hypothetical protein [Xanthomonas sp. LMG 12461]|uniref:hypothetical protein n=1 Tax=Xanthomonas sp. LMG 12461 TaxID=2014543 RepID=UPI001264DDBA|nr:hypothetical protein [Xanthomonas sp. LMG 12461]KAB7767357.1 hypothetical protein CEK68_08005 [Xanthomonas sp. LMG 12461]
MLAGVGGIAAIVVGWGIGLFEAKEVPVPPALQAGKDVAAGEWSLRFDHVETSDRLPDGEVVSRDGRKAIVLYLQATNRTAQTSGSLVQAVALKTPPRGADARPTAYLLRDRAATTELQPGLPEQVALVWTYPATEQVAGRVRFDITARTFKAFDNLYAQPLWTDPHPVGVVELPLGAARAGAQAGEP